MPVEEKQNEYLENRSTNVTFQYAINFQRIEHILKRRRWT